ncbi:hypothetical protein HEP87_60280 [Streptomyces sp. S1D4-11]|nr:hypothetical protein [Streptomyces sp. S1D4-11]
MTEGVAVSAELGFSAGDLAQLRFAVSPMWEVGTSFRLLRSGGTHPAHRPWAEQVRPRVLAAGLDRGLLAELIPPAGYVPDFLNPAPDGPAPALAAELAGIMAAPPARVRQDLDRLAHDQGGLGPRSRTLYADPPARPPACPASRRRSRPTGSWPSPPTGRGSGPSWTPMSSTGPRRSPSRAPGTCSTSCTRW